MLNIALFEPEIPPNTGNIIRLCANTGARLHLIEPLGFIIDDKKMRRAGLDYHEFADIQIHNNFNSLINYLNINYSNFNIYSISTKGDQYYHQIAYKPNDLLLFGPESRGLPNNILNQYNKIRIPMLANSRSLNLANSVSIILYEALRQINFNNLK